MGSSSSINFSGLSSGIDTTSIISELLTIDRYPEQSWKLNIQRLQAQQTAYGTVSASLLGLQNAAQALDGIRSFQLVTANTSDNTVATVTAATGAQVGNHTLVVNNLAQAQLIGSAAQTSQTAPLNATGQILINGKAINVQASDSLQTLAGNINSAGAGVTASIITPTSGQYYLTIGSNNSGLQGQISLSDVGGTNLLGGVLGIFSGTKSIAHTVSPGVAGSDLFADSGTSIGTLQGQTAPLAGNVSLTIGGTTANVNIDLNTSLTQIANNINGVFANSARVVSVTDPITNASKQQLQITGLTGFTDANNVLANLGIAASNFATSGSTSRQLTAAQDASFVLDGINATRANNTFTDAISGVTINLLKPSPAPVTPVTLSVASDTATLTTNINSFVTAFNSTVDTISNQATFDPQTGKTGALFGDLTASSILDQITSNVSGALPGLPSSFSALSQIGITLDQGNHLQVDSGKLATALTNNLSQVAQLFQAYGTTTNSQVQFVSSTTDTQPSTSVGYAVQVSQPATQAVITAPQKQTTTLLTDENLTFGGVLFGSTVGTPLTGHTVVLHAGSTIDDVISQINADPVVSQQVSASKTPSGYLQLTSKGYGTAADFAVVSSAVGSGNTSGIGTANLEAHGQDVQGTINGESATGVGQFLTGSQLSSNINPVKGQAYGLQLRVTATTAGSYGNVVFTQGAADLVKNYANSQTDQFTGGLTTATNSLQDNINDLQSNITDLEARLVDEQARLQEQFTFMETSVASIKAAGAGLASLGISTLSSSSSSSSSSSH